MGPSARATPRIAKSTTIVATAARTILAFDMGTSRASAPSRRGRKPSGYDTLVGHVNGNVESDDAVAAQCGTVVGRQPQKLAIDLVIVRTQLWRACRDRPRRP